MKNKLNGIIEMNYLYLIMKETKITTFIEKKVQTLKINSKICVKVMLMFSHKIYIANMLDIKQAKVFQIL